MMYFFPGGGAGMLIPALAANSAKLAGTRRFCILHARSAWFNGCKFGMVLVALAAEAGWELPAGAGVAESGAGVAGAVAVESDAGGDAMLEVEAPLFLLQPVASNGMASARAIHPPHRFGWWPANRSKSKDFLILG